MAAVVRRRAVYLHLVSADMFGVILDISADTAAGADSIDADALATARGRLLPGDGGQIMLGMASADIGLCFGVSNDRQQCWLADEKGSRTKTIMGKMRTKMPKAGKNG